MHLKKISVRNFRLLHKVDFYFNKKTTLIVGRNNSGKTSLTELFRRISSPSLGFTLQDFSISTHKKFWQVYQEYKNTKDNDLLINLPFIEIELCFDYKKDIDSLGMLSDFIIDLNPKCTVTIVNIKYYLKKENSEKIFSNINLKQTEQKNQITEFNRIIKDRVPKLFGTNVFIIDPNNRENRKKIDYSKFQELFFSNFISAQRGLDDVTDKKRDVIGNILSTLYEFSEKANDSGQENETLSSMSSMIEGIQGNIDRDFTSQLDTLYVPILNLFGYPGMGEPNLTTETIINIESLLKNNTSMQYRGGEGINLPETYSGLGIRNLIFILLKIYEFYNLYKSELPLRATHLIFIEEPEAHLHPQMQEVFISKIEEISKLFAKTFSNDPSWPVQFIITTHSSHIANRAAFKKMRYFLRVNDPENKNCYMTKTKDLFEGLHGKKKKKEREFLHKYFTLTKCDLLFSDKAILIEGTSERILLHKFISMFEEKNAVENPLSSQYVSIVEIGGAYAHLFFGLIDFLELKTLFITDLDTVKKVPIKDKNGKSTNKRKKCIVSEGEFTSNETINKWFSNKSLSPTVLIDKKPEEKTILHRYITYQIPEQGETICGRSFEQAFILANKELFSIEKDNIEDSSWNTAKKIKKTDFAIKYAIYETNWVLPKYIYEGLSWLVK